jgi:homeobox domain-containing protein
MARPNLSSQQQHHLQHHHHGQSQQLLVSRTSPEKNQLNRISPSVANDLSAVTISDLSARDVLPPRVRMRTTFDPEQELPRLQRWFSDNQHPTRFQVSRFINHNRHQQPQPVFHLTDFLKNILYISYNCTFKN